MQISRSFVAFIPLVFTWFASWDCSEKYVFIGRLLREYVAIKVIYGRNQKSVSIVIVELHLNSGWFFASIVDGEF